MTPVCTETPNSAKKPTPDETLKFVPVSHRATMPPTGAMATFKSTRLAHFTEVNIV